MIINTPRLLLRNLHMDDNCALLSYNQRPEFYRWLTKIPTEETTQAYIQNAMMRNAESPRRYWYLAITLKDTNALLGDIILWSDDEHPEQIASIGYGLHPDHWGQGIMTEAVAAITSFGHETLGFHRIQTGADARNCGSWRVLEKCGYMREGVRAYAVKTPEDWSISTFEYASIRPDLLKR